MSDDKTNRGEPDRSLYDHNDPNERRYMKEKLKKKHPTATDRTIEAGIAWAVHKSKPSESRAAIEALASTHIIAELAWGKNKP